MRAKVHHTETKSKMCGPRWSYSRRGYAIAQSLRQLKHFKLASLGTLTVLGITLCLPVMLFFASDTLSALSERSVQGESLTAYLDGSLADIEGAALARNWAAQPDIARTEYISRKKALAMLEENADIRNAIDILGTNPLPGAVVIYPQSKDISAAEIDALAALFRQLPEVERVQIDLQWVKRLEAVVTLVKLIGGLLAAFLTLTALFVIGNTIRLELARRREEIEVANLLGAPKPFINRAFLYAGALYGFLGGAIACVIALIALNTVKAPADNLSSLYLSTFTVKMPDLSQIVLVIFISTLLGVAGAVNSLYHLARKLTLRGKIH